MKRKLDPKEKSSEGEPPTKSRKTQHVPSSPFKYERRLDLNVSELEILYDELSKQIDKESTKQEDIDIELLTVLNKQRSEVDELILGKVGDEIDYQNDTMFHSERQSLIENDRLFAEQLQKEEEELMKELDRERMRIEKEDLELARRLQAEEEQMENDEDLDDDREDKRKEQTELDAEYARKLQEKYDLEDQNEDQDEEEEEIEGEGEEEQNSSQRATTTVRPQENEVTERRENEDFPPMNEMGGGGDWIADEDQGPPPLPPPSLPQPTRRKKEKKSDSESSSSSSVSSSSSSEEERQVVETVPPIAFRYSSREEEEEAKKKRKKEVTNRNIEMAKQFRKSNQDEERKKKKKPKKIIQTEMIVISSSSVSSSSVTLSEDSEEEETIHKQKKKKKKEEIGSINVTTIPPPPLRPLERESITEQQEKRRDEPEITTTSSSTRNETMRSSLPLPPIRSSEQLSGRLERVSQPLCRGRKVEKKKEEEKGPPPLQVQQQPPRLIPNLNSDGFIPSPPRHPPQQQQQQEEEQRRRKPLSQEEKEKKKKKNEERRSKPIPPMKTGPSQSRSSKGRPRLIPRRSSKITKLPIGRRKKPVPPPQTTRSSKSSSSSTPSEEEVEQPRKKRRVIVPPPPPPPQPPPKRRISKRDINENIIRSSDRKKKKKIMKLTPVKRRPSPPRVPKARRPSSVSSLHDQKIRKEQKQRDQNALRRVQSAKTPQQLFNRRRDQRSLQTSSLLSRTGNINRKPESIEERMKRLERIDQRRKKEEQRLLQKQRQQNQQRMMASKGPKKMMVISPQVIDNLGKKQLKDKFDIKKKKRKKKKKSNDDPRLDPELQRILRENHMKRNVYLNPNIKQPELPKPKPKKLDPPPPPLPHHLPIPQNTSSQQQQQMVRKPPEMNQQERLRLHQQQRLMEIQKQKQMLFQRQQQQKQMLLQQQQRQLQNPFQVQMNRRLNLNMYPQQQQQQQQQTNHPLPPHLQHLRLQQQQRYQQQLRQQQQQQQQQGRFSQVPKHLQHHLFPQQQQLHRPNLSKHFMNLRQQMEMRQKQEMMRTKQQQKMKQQQQQRNGNNNGNNMPFFGPPTSSQRQPMGSPSNMTTREMEGAELSNHFFVDDDPYLQEMRTPKGMTVTLYKHQRIALHWLVDRENGRTNGGILADDMGLGKTIEMAALICQQARAGHKKSSKGGAGRTLVVAPLALIGQWKRELDSKTNMRWDVFVYHGGGRRKNVGLVKLHDIVITTYGVVSQECPLYDKKHGTMRPKEPGPLLLINWDRIILDEAHSIKNPNTRSAQTCCKLKAKKRWCLTGTPVQNKLEDLYSLYKFLQFRPYNDHKEFKLLVKNIQANPRSFGRFRSIQKKILLRRHKHQKIKGEKILDLPEKKMMMVEMNFDEHEQEFYDIIFKKSQVTFNRFLEEGSVMKNYAHVLTMLLRLRQVCDHPYLVQRLGTKTMEKLYFIEGDSSDEEEDEDEDEDEYSSDEDEDFNPEKQDGGSRRGERIVIDLEKDKKREKERRKKEREQKRREQKEIRAREKEYSRRMENVKITQECTLCNGALVDPICTQCTPDGNHHWFCSECLHQHIFQQSREECPVCRRRINTTVLRRLTNIRQRRETEMIRKKGLTPSSKTKAIISKVKEILEVGNDKILIISQWTSFLDLLHVPLKKLKLEKGIHKGLNVFDMFEGIDGRMSIKKREETIRRFNNNDVVRILLVSMKACGVGLNLMAANQVFFVDPWWNPAVENQAIDRVHRLGQKKEVRVYRLKIRNSVEDRIEKIKKRKGMLANVALGQRVSASKLTLEDFKDLFK